MDKLLPCPMCGGEADFVKADVPQYKYRVACTKCHLMTRGSAFRNDEFNASDWNTRHTPEGWRPDDCRNELQAKGKPYPKSGCAVCGNGGMAGCPYERQLAAAPKWGGE